MKQLTLGVAEAQLGGFVLYPVINKQSDSREVLHIVTEPLVHQGFRNPEGIG